MQFADILTQYNIPRGTSGPHVRDQWINVDCVYCAPGSRKWHLGYNIASGGVSCWRCGRHPLAPTVALLTGLPLPQARALVAGLERVAYVPRDVTSGTFKAPRGIGPLLPCHNTYLEERGFDPGRIEAQWGIGGIGRTNDLKYRIYIPIHKDGEPVSWTTRSIAPNARLRYISAPPSAEAVSHKTLLYGADYCGHAAIIHEGPIDVWATGPGAVATMGTAYTRAQIAQIAKFLVRAICFDSEPIAQQRARHLMELLAPYPGETLNIILESGTDAASAAETELAQLRKTVLGV